MILSFLLLFHSLDDVLQNCAFSGELSAEHLEKTMENELPGKSYIREIYGAINLVLSPHEIADETFVIVKDEDGFLEPVNVVEFDVSYAATKLYELRQICECSETDFAYISFPSKTNSQTTLAHYGIDTNQEEIRTSFLRELARYGIHILNVRELLEKDGYTVKDIFYKTDHHWNTTAGLYGARAIADYLNVTFDCSLRSDLLNENLFTYTTYKDLWFGESGRRYSKTWVGTLDNFTKILPIYDTSLKMGSQYGIYNQSGDFSMLVNESGYQGDIDLYNYSAHYSYGNGIGSPTWIHNDNVSNHKILIIKDSFSMVVIPFLSLATSDIAVWDMRTTKDGLYDYIKENDFDIVLVEYTDFWTPNMYYFN